MITLNATQQSIADATSKTVSWLFAINDGTARYWSTKEYTYSAQAYDNRVIPDSFDGITLNSSFSNNGIICPSTLEFQVADPAATFTAVNFVDKELTVSLVEDDGTNETIMAVWKFRVTKCYKRSKKLFFECEDYFTKFLNGQYPNTPLISALAPDDSSITDDNMCVPLIFGTAYIPSRSLYITDKRYYLLGAAGPTYTIIESRSPLDWSSVSVWDNSYTYTQSSHTLDGTSYRFVRPILVDSDSDGTMDSMGLFYDSTFHDIQFKMTRSDTFSLTDYADILHYILEDMGVPSANIDDAVFAAAKVIYTSWGITFNGGFFTKEDRATIISQILNECHSVIKQTAEGKIGLYPLSKTSQVTLSTDDIRKSGEIGDTTLSYREDIETEYDSAYVTFCNGGPQGITTKVRVEANGTHASISDDTLEMPHLNGTVSPQAMGELYYQRSYGNAGNITADLRDDYLVLQPDDLITIDNALYGPSMTAIIEQIQIHRDLTVSIEAMKCRWTIDDFGDLAPSAVTIITDDSTSVWSPVIQGADDDTDANKISSRVKIGNSIWLDGVAETIIVGATEGILIDGGNTRISVGTSNEIIIDGANKRIDVGTSAAICIDGANTKIVSSNYVSGALGAGFYLDPNLLEVGNIAARGLIRTAMFQYNVISAISGSILISQGGDVLDADMTASDNSTMTWKGTNTCAVGDFLRIKEGTDDEWFEVTSIASAPTYTVTRDKDAQYSSNANPAWKKGATVVNYGASGKGGLYLTASDTNAPHFSIFTHAGAPWDTITTHLRLGNLNGFLGYASDLYGIGIGTTNDYLKYDPTNGLRIAGNITITGGSGIGSDNQLTNGNFESWTSGTSVAPDGWILDGTDATIGRATATKKIGNRSAKITRVGTDCYLYQNFNDEKSIEYWQGRLVTLSCWAWSNTANAVRIGIFDDIGSASSAYHTGDSTWQLLSISYTINASASYARARCRVVNSDTFAYFDGAMLVEGSMLMPYADRHLGDMSGYHAILEATGLNFYNTTSLLLSVGGTELAGYSGATKTLSILSTGVIYLGDQANEHIKISTSGLDVKDGSTVLANYGATTTIGQVAASQNNILISSGAMYFRNNTTNIISILNTGVGSINLLAGSDITLIGDDSDPAKIIFNSQYYSISLSVDYTNTSFYIAPDTTGHGSLLLGSDSYTWADFKVFFNHDMYLRRYIDADNVTEIIMGAGLVRLLAEVSGDQAVVDLYSYGSSKYFSPVSNKTVDLGTASTAWDNAYADDWNNVADIPLLDDRDDLSFVHKIKGSGIIDPRTGLEMIDDDTLPDFVKALSKDGNKEILLDADGKPYFTMKAMSGWLMGMIKQLDKKYENHLQSYHF